MYIIKCIHVNILCDIFYAIIKYMKNLKKIRTHSRRNPWTIDEIIKCFQQYNNDNGHYPSSIEIDECEYLPSVRTIERSFGGLQKVRKELQVSDASLDLRKGEHSTNRAKKIWKRAHELEHSVYKILCDRFSKQLVHREFFYTDDHRTRADFFIFDNVGGFCVDIFYAETRRNISGCLNLKQRKYYGTGGSVLPYPVIFLQMNEDFNQSILDEIHSNKKLKLHEGYYLMDINTFKSFCLSREPLNILANWDSKKHDLD